jgi:glycine hydroxymethyltransferase
MAHITVNKNSIPNDPESPFVTSGIRLGTPAITTRGFKEKESIQVANLIADVLDQPDDEKNIALVKNKVNELTHQFPVYSE